ncbi:unnamed protein product, partial [marine sediment metagenome]
MEVFPGADAGEPGDHRILGDALEIEALATGEDGERYLVGLGGRQHEHNVGRRLLQGLEESIGSGLGEHVDLVDDIDFIFCHTGGRT